MLTQPDRQTKIDATGGCISAYVRLGIEQCAAKQRQQCHECQPHKILCLLQLQSKLDARRP